MKAQLYSAYFVAVKKRQDDSGKTSGRFEENVRTIWGKRQDDLGKTSGRFGM
jgi:hypothetical protein